MLPKTIIKSALRKAGFAIYAIPKGDSEVRAGYAYAQAHPNATLAPWLSDTEFMNAFERAKHNTLVDIYRLYDLWTLVAETAKVGGDIVEVGVWRGGSGCMMAKRAQLMASDRTVWLCDTFAGVVKAGGADSAYTGGEHRDTSEGIVDQLAEQLGINNIRKLVGVFPDDSGPNLQAEKIGLLHVDVDVYKSAKDCVNYLWDRMDRGAAVVFDDYGFVGCEGVTRCVDEFRDRKDMFYVHNLNGHAVLIKR